MGSSNKPTMVNWYGKQVKLIDLARMYNKDIRTVKTRYFKLGWPLEKALLTPPSYYRGKGPTMVEWEGRRVPLVELAREFGMVTKTVKNRLKTGLPLKAALTLPTLHSGRKAANKKPGSESG